ncbi:colicin D domain-containing protein, partial [Methylobacter sp.]|uniref:RHS repeat-associated core domain-containing protein n=1 Tax=Methylobacter sp. TaxID=2051955 RepID=UPI001219BB32
ISQITYEPDGQVNGWNWGNNQQSERFHDLAGRPVIVSLGFDPNSQLLNSRYYGYDAAGRQTSAIDDVDPKQNQHHEYDPLDRLTSSQRGEPQLSRIDYSYDLSGNRTEKITDSTTLHSYSTDPNSNRLHSQSDAQTVNYNYDPAGNLTSDGSFSHSYNAAGRRTASTNTATGQTTGYGYDALGQRITKNLNGITSQYFYDEQGHLIGEYDASGQPIQEILWLGELPVAVLKPITPASATTATIDLYYIHADHLGTPRKIIRPGDNRVVWSWESEAFGNSLPDQNPSGLGNFVFNLRFPGQYYDQETGLFYNYFRDYDPKTGRYIESDPIGLAGGINTYSYVGGNPINYTDPKGLFWDFVDFVFFAQSAYEYYQCPSSDNAINLGLDTVGLLPIVPALGVIKRADDALDAAKAAENLADFSQKQLDKKFKHAADFGVDSTKKNPSTLAEYQKALTDHLTDAATTQRGTYGFVKDSSVFFNSNTNNVVVLDNAGNFVTGFKLSPGTAQFENFMTNGVLR